MSVNVLGSETFTQGLSGSHSVTVPTGTTIMLVLGSGFHGSGTGSSSVTEMTLSGTGAVDATYIDTSLYQGTDPINEAYYFEEPASGAGTLDITVGAVSEGWTFVVVYLNAVDLSNPIGDVAATTNDTAGASTDTAALSGVSDFDLAIGVVYSYQIAPDINPTGQGQTSLESSVYNDAGVGVGYEIGESTLYYENLDYYQSVTFVVNSPLYSASGGAVISGEADFDVKRTYTASGGARGGGTASITFELTYTASGGAAAGGTTRVTDYTKESSGGGEVSGFSYSSPVQVTGEGGAIAGGGVRVYSFEIESAGGAVGSGAASHSGLTTYSASGGAVAGGSTRVQEYELSSIGGVRGSGAVEHTGPLYTASGGAVAGGESAALVQYKYTPGGGALVSGAAKVTGKTKFFTPEDVIALSVIESAVIGGTRAFSAADVEITTLIEAADVAEVGDGNLLAPRISVATVIERGDVAPEQSAECDGSSLYVVVAALADSEGRIHDVLQACAAPDKKGIHRGEHWFVCPVNGTWHLLSEGVKIGGKYYSAKAAQDIIAERAK